MTNTGDYEELRKVAWAAARKMLTPIEGASASSVATFDAIAVSVADAVVDALLSALADGCPEDHSAWAHSTTKACPNCGVGVELNVELPELPCCFRTASSGRTESGNA